MKKPNLVLIALFALVFNGCEKADKTVYTISGHFFHDCNMEPVKDFEVQLYQEPANGGSAGIKLAATYTDSVGYFKFEFQEQNKQDLYFRITAGRRIMEGIPHGTLIENLDVYYSPSTNIQVRLKVNNPYTINDTLVINDLRDGSNLSIPGPFISGLIYNAPNYPLFAMYYTGEIKGLNWAIYPDDTSNKSQQYTINKYCNDTLTVTVNIN